MRIRPLHLLLLTTTVAGLTACSGDKDASGSAAASGAPRPAGGSKMLHVTQTFGQCTFDFDAPEELKEKTRDGMSVTLDNPSFEFIGYDGTTLHAKPEHPLDGIKGRYKDVYRGATDGINLAIVTDVKYDKPTPEKHDIAGTGGEVYSNDRSLGCTFSCDGVRTREADVVAMCKSVRIKVTPEKKP